MQVDGLQDLLSREIIDRQKVGIMGWSYGGYLSLRAVTSEMSSVFSFAIAGAPVTCWSGYDTHYTERCAWGVEPAALTCRQVPRAPLG